MGLGSPLYGTLFLTLVDAESVLNTDIPTMALFTAEDTLSASFCPRYHRTLRTDEEDFTDIAD